MQVQSGAHQQVRGAKPGLLADLARRLPQLASSVRKEAHLQTSHFTIRNGEASRFGNDELLSGCQLPAKLACMQEMATCRAFQVTIEILGQLHLAIAAARLLAAQRSAKLGGVQQLLVDAMAKGAVLTWCIMQKPSRSSGADACM